MENAPNRSTGYAGESDTGSLVKEQVKQGTQSVVENTQQTASQVAESAKTQARSVFTSQKDQAAGTLGTVAQALRQTGDTLQTQNSPATGAFTGVAERIEGFSSYLQSSDVDTLMRDAEDFARRNTAVFLGGGFLLGLAAARFLKSSAPRSQYSGGGSYGYPRDYGSYGASSYGGSSYRGGNASYDYGSAPYHDSTIAPAPQAGYMSGDSLDDSLSTTRSTSFDRGADLGVSDGTASESY